jgi:hypothetical protein
MKVEIILILIHLHRCAGQPEVDKLVNLDSTHSKDEDHDDDAPKTTKKPKKPCKSNISEDKVIHALVFLIKLIIH